MSSDGKDTTQPDAAELRKQIERRALEIALQCLEKQRSSEALEFIQVANNVAPCYY